MKKEKIFSSFGILPKEEMLEVKPNFKKLQISWRIKEMCN